MADHFLKYTPRGRDARCPLGDRLWFGVAEPRYDRESTD